MPGNSFHDTLRIRPCTLVGLRDLRVYAVRMMLVETRQLHVNFYNNTRSMPPSRTRVMNCFSQSLPSRWLASSTTM
jgi:hypothetical protein